MQEKTKEEIDAVFAKIERKRNYFSDLFEEILTAQQDVEHKEWYIKVKLLEEDYSLIGPIEKIYYTIIIDDYDCSFSIRNACTFESMYGDYLMPEDLGWKGDFYREKIIKTSATGDFLKDEIRDFLWKISREGTRELSWTSKIEDTEYEVV